MFVAFPSDGSSIAVRWFFYRCSISFRWILLGSTFDRFSFDVRQIFNICSVYFRRIDFRFSFVEFSVFRFSSGGFAVDFYRTEGVPERRIFSLGALPGWVVRDSVFHVLVGPGGAAHDPSIASPG